MEIPSISALGLQVRKRDHNNKVKSESQTTNPICSNLFLKGINLANENKSCQVGYRVCVCFTNCPAIAQPVKSTLLRECLLLYLSFEMGATRGAYQLIPTSQ